MAVDLDGMQRRLTSPYARADLTRPQPLPPGYTRAGQAWEIYDRYLQAQWTFKEADAE